MAFCTTGNPEGAVQAMPLPSWARMLAQLMSQFIPASTEGRHSLTAVRVFLARYRAIGLEGTFALP
jgi:hypothetical protein